MYSPIPRDYFNAGQKFWRIGENPTDTKQQQTYKKANNYAHIYRDALDVDLAFVADLLAMPLANGRFMYICTEACLRSSQTDWLVDTQACNILNQTIG